jgi:DNA-binding transcriptional LysR family regulator
VAGNDSVDLCVDSAIEEEVVADAQHVGAREVHHHIAVGVTAGFVPERLVGVPLTEAIVELVVAGRGIAVLASWAVERERSAGSIVTRPVGDGVHRTWSIVSRARSEAAEHLTVLAAAMMDSLRPLIPAPSPAQRKS